LVIVGSTQHSHSTPFHKCSTHTSHIGQHVSHYPSSSSSNGRKRPYSPPHSSSISPQKRPYSSRVSNVSLYSPPYGDWRYRSRFETEDFYQDPVYPIQDKLYPLPYAYPFADEFALSLPYPAAPYPPAFLSPQSFPSPLYSTFANVHELRDEYNWKEREREERRDMEERYERREREEKEERIERHDEFYVKEGTKLYLDNTHLSDEEISFIHSFLYIILFYLVSFSFFFYFD
jgi:hypothetical protein